MLIVFATTKRPTGTSTSAGRHQARFRASFSTGGRPRPIESQHVRFGSKADIAMSVGFARYVPKAAILPLAWIP